MRFAGVMTAGMVALAAFNLGPPPAAAYESLDPIPALLPPGKLNNQARARARALSAFHLKDNQGQKARGQRYKFAGRKLTVFKYSHATELAGRDVIFKFRMPGKRKTWMRFELEF